ncbi:MAG: hypothetical protein K2F72_03795 [Muribaculaceae bacterium]|nr:hypothetical protein [Muribaculaceae bacterium]
MEFNNAKNWVTNRTTFFYTHLADYFKLGTPRPVTIDAGRTDDVRLTVNNVPLCGRSFDGKYFQGKVLRVQGEHAGGTPVKGWKVEVKTNGQTTATNYGGGTLAFTVPVGCQSVTVTSVPDDSGIDDALVDAGQAVDPAQPVEVIDMTGRLRGTFRSVAAAEASLNAGIYILRQGALSTKYAIGR